MASGEAMSVPVTATPESTDAQRRVVEEPAQRKALLTAGAKTCKTFTLVRRIVSEGLARGSPRGGLLARHLGKLRNEGLAGRTVSYGTSSREPYRQCHGAQTFEDLPSA
ncbi:hypothetical protein [Streptomyces adustus]|uniref:hypothetical protein n=1 Tax=Streptomyces adustus TaxID=1609272 RepID=UPI00371FF448